MTNILTGTPPNLTYLHEAVRWYFLNTGFYEGINT